MKELQELLKGKIEEYQFQSLSKKEGKDQPDLQVYEFKPLDRSQVLNSEELDKVIRIERENAEEKSFDIAPVVREYRGMNRQVEIYKQRRIEEEVERRISRVEVEAFQTGYVEGLKKGRREVFDQTRNVVEEKVSLLSNLISEVLNSKYEILAVEKESVYILIRNLVKWVTLKELKEDGEYIYRLLEKLVVELQTRSNIFIQVDGKNFEKMPDVLKHVQEIIGEMENVRIEVDYDIEGPGIVLSTENEVINGSLKEQFRSFDRLFSKVGLEKDDVDIEGLLRSVEEAKNSEPSPEAMQAVEELPEGALNMARRDKEEEKREEKKKEENKEKEEDDDK